MVLKLYCTCGASWQAVRLPRRVVAAYQREWRAWHEGHAGPGHAACDARTAARARAKSEEGVMGAPVTVGRTLGRTPSDGGRSGRRGDATRVRLPPAHHPSAGVGEREARHGE